MENLYELLEVSKKASPEVIEKAYKTLVKKYHPDVAKDKQNAEKMMKKLNTAYEILSDKKLREEYDFNLEQEENRNKINNIDSTTTNVYTQYNDYYNIQNQQNTNVRNNDNNIYNNNYNQEYDYANNANFFKRIFNLNLDKNTKIFLVIILGIIILMIFRFFSLVGNLFNSNKNINQNNNSNLTVSQQSNKEEKEYITNDVEPINLVNEFLNEFKQYNFSNILNETQVSNLNKDRVMYEYIIRNSTYTIADYEVTNKKAKITVNIDRFDVESAVIEYAMNKWQNMDFTTSENETEIVKEFLEKNIKNKVTKQTTILVNNIEGKWKINLTNSNIETMLGTSIM